jgi:hypothetical protein
MKTGLTLLPLNKVRKSGLTLLPLNKVKEDWFNFTVKLSQSSFTLFKGSKVKLVFLYFISR